MSSDYVRVGQIADFPVGYLKKVMVGTEEALVANVAGKLYAITNSCTHRGGPLNEGDLKGTAVVCPWHGGQFDVTTGKAIKPPPMKDEALFDLRIDGSDVFLRKK